MRGFDDALVTAGAAIVVDRRGYIVGWNEGAEAMLGHRGTDVVGRACHHVLCGRTPDGELVCHPWCVVSPTSRRDLLGDELVLYPRSASRERLRVVLSVFHIGREDAQRGWIVHLITSAELLPATSYAASMSRVAWAPQRRASKLKPSDTSQN